MNVETAVGEELEKAAEGSNIAVRVQVNSDWVTSIIYDCECDNILTPENVKAMARIEERILQLPNWPKMCFATSIDDSGCSASAYESFASKFPQPSTVTQSEIDAKLTELTTEPTYTNVKGLFDKGFSS